MQGNCLNDERFYRTHCQELWCSPREDEEWRLTHFAISKKSAIPTTQQLEVRYLVPYLRKNGVCNAAAVAAKQAQPLTAQPKDSPFWSSGTASSHGTSIPPLRVADLSLSQLKDTQQPKPSTWTCCRRDSEEYVCGFRPYKLEADW